ncbi:MAG: YggT family protein [Clostridia bacterium]
MLVQIASFLVESIAGFFVLLLLARFHFQWLRVPFQNPAGQFVLAMTSWLVMPVRRVVKGLRGWDIATLLIAWALQALSIAARLMLFGAEPTLVPILAVALVDLVRYSVYLLIFAVLVLAVMSWFRSYSPLTPALDAFTRPFLRPFRRLIPPVGGFDLTPLALLVLLQVVLIVLEYVKPLAARLG